MYRATASVLLLLFCCGTAVPAALAMATPRPHACWPVGAKRHCSTSSDGIAAKQEHCPVCKAPMTFNQAYPRPEITAPADGAAHPFITEFYFNGRSFGETVRHVERAPPSKTSR